MAAPATSTTTTTAPSDSTTTADPKQQQPLSPPAPPAAEPDDAPPQKRKLEELGFHHSPYYKMRAIVANLRGRFIQVCRAANSQKKYSALEILKEIKVLMELSKKKRLDLYSVEPVQPLIIPTTTTTSSKDEPSGKTQCALKNQVPPISLAGNFVPNTGGNISLKPDNSEAAGQNLVSPVEIKKEDGTSKITDHTKQPGRVLQGSYVVGGSPIGCNFLMWPGSKVAYYGLTKAEWLARQSAK